MNYCQLDWWKLVKAKRKKKLISFDDAPTNENHAELIYKKLLEYEISHEIFTFIQ